MLNLDTEIIRDLLDKARQFQAKEEVSFPEETDDESAFHVLADFPDDAVYEEAVSFINNLRPDQQATLVALMYLGRGDFESVEWNKAMSLAQEELTDHTGQYLLSRPLAPEYIENGMDLLGVNYRD